VSILSSDYTDGLALEAMRLIFEALPEVLKNPSSVLWRHKLHNASCLAGMAIGNASVGMNHALAHSLGAHFDVPHGRANGAFLLTTIDYNAGVPRKITPHSTYPMYVVRKKYMRAAQFLGLPMTPDASGKITEAEAVLALKRAIYDLLTSIGQPTSISELGIPMESIQEKLTDLVAATYEDLSVRTSPRAPLFSEIGELFHVAYPRRERP
jgi:acetaldehyde dehydrogenase/alcohol dehydrogenase